LERKIALLYKYTYRTHVLPSAVRPFFDKVTIDLPGVTKRLTISSPGASTKPFVKSLKVNGVEIDRPVLQHSELAYGGEIAFEMSDKPQEWASATVIGKR
jgi:putative alpha-1,2-mannosidase